MELRISTAADWESVLQSFNYFHDAVTRSLTFENDQAVEPDGTMVMSRGEGTVTVTVQTQNLERRGGTLTFHGVRTFQYDASSDVSPGEVESVRLNGDDLLRFVFAECCVVAAFATVEPF